jgi:hypothetical protein
VFPLFRYPPVFKQYNIVGIHNSGQSVRHDDIAVKNNNHKKINMRSEHFEGNRSVVLLFLTAIPDKETAVEIILAKLVYC